ncbi:MAG TPA: hypothetical protein VN203_08160, partial [Candidatus Acidoferrum sp.]|nr:hypothetical protein [Candidatus Acidoferrum sp.]
DPPLPGRVARATARLLDLSRTGSPDLLVRLGVNGMSRLTENVSKTRGKPEEDTMRMPSVQGFGPASEFLLTPKHMFGIYDLCLG